MNDPDILFCDNHLLVLNKPSGMLSQPNESGEESLECFGKRWLKEKFEKPGNVFLHVVHRLDREVSGIVLCARTSKALSRLNAAMRHETKEGFQKIYQAVVEGQLQQEEAILEHFLTHGEHRAEIDLKTGKLCRLKYRVLNRFNHYTQIQVELITGRYHQIRAQLSAIGHPIAGDQKYGSKIPSQYFYLHHLQLHAPHPISSEVYTWNCSLPDFWKQLPT